MNISIPPLQAQSLKESCIRHLENLILSGEWQIGMRLPAERELAEALGISRPVLHEALVDLSAKGLVTIEPRRGTFVSDFRTSGSCALLSSLLDFHGDQLDPAFIRSMVAMRLLIETETAALAGRNRSPQHLEQFEQLLACEREAEISRQDVPGLVELDFSFHLLVAVASGNLMYPLILNSFKSVYTHLTGLFFQRYSQSAVIEEVFALHQRLVAALRVADPAGAAQAMQELLRHGEKHLLNSVIQPPEAEASG
ncbi:MAG TPA: FadR/GntR family transcriptional regulator [Anaerolineaceae bacterium]|nr:FadR/GntR family transcriptional regulator [Anaerolineaceae bacterium]